MKRKLFLSFFVASLFLISSFDTQQIATTSQKLQETVFVCTGPNSQKYHKSKNCRGLQKCEHSIVSKTKSDAMSSKYTACKICYK